MQNLNKLWPCGFKNGMTKWVSYWFLTFIRALKSLKNCTFKGSFYPNHIMFRQEISEELCVTTLKDDVKFKEKLTRGLKNDIKNLVNFHASRVVMCHNTEKGYKI